MTNQDYSEQLQELMQRAGLSSFRELSRQAGVSRWQVQQLRVGQLLQMRLENLQKLSQALQVTLSELLVIFGSQDEQDSTQAETASLREEYDRLQTQLQEQRESLMQEFQRSSLDTIEFWLKQWPKAVYAAQQNPNLPASNIVSLASPIEQLLQQWGVEAIAPVGSEVPYDPRWHQLRQGTARPGDSVRVIGPGYSYADRLLYRAEVNPIEV